MTTRSPAAPPRDQPADRPDPHHRRRLPGRRVGRRPGRLPVAGQRLAHHGRWQGRRLDAHRAGLQRAEVPLGPAVRGRRRRLRRHVLGGLQPRAHEREPDRPGDERPGHLAGGQRRRAGARRPAHDLRLRARPGRQPRRAPSTRSRASRPPGACPRTTCAPSSRATPSSRRWASWASRGCTSWRSTSTSTGCCPDAGRRATTSYDRLDGLRHADRWSGSP